MEANASLPLSPTPPSLHPKKVGELMKEAGSLVRQSHDPHSAIWISGSHYPAQYLVRTTRSMTSQCKDGPHTPSIEQGPEKGFVAGGKEELQRDSLLVCLPWEHLSLQQVAETLDGKEPAHVSSHETSLDTTVAFFPPVNDLVRHQCASVLDFYLPDELFQGLKVRKLQAANRNQHRTITGKTGSSLLRKNARKNTAKVTPEGFTQEPVIFGTPSHNSPAEKQNSSQDVAQSCSPEVKHCPVTLPAAEVSPPNFMHGCPSTKVHAKGTLLSSFKGDSQPIGWLPVQALDNNESFENCKPDRNEAKWAVEDANCRQDDKSVPRACFSHGQGSLCLSNSGEIKEVGHVTWEVYISCLM